MSGVKAAGGGGDGGGHSPASGAQKSPRVASPSSGCSAGAAFG